jgi:aminoglycoside phosphotransferase family enzyme/predicted kinase
MLCRQRGTAMRGFSDGAGFSQDDVIRSLQRPAAYPHPVGEITHIQTHASHVLLAGAFAYKIKKPLSLGFLDYSRLDERKRLCEEEVRLNRRLCAGMYLGVEAITRHGSDFEVGGAGAAVEYAVQMRRVAPGTFLSEMIDHGDAAPEHLHAVARTLAEFHRSAPTSASVAVHGRRETIWRNWEENFEQTRACVGLALPAARMAHIRSYVEQWLRDNAALVEERAGAGRVREIHGDLRSDAIVIDPGGGICVMDCIEFSDRLRCGDVAGDVAFLAMDLEFRGRRDLADEFVAAYLAAAGDETLPLVLDFYRCYRAYVRGKVEWMARSQSSDAAYRAAADARGARYFELSESYASPPGGPHLVLMAGLSGCGKSFVAGALAARIGAVVLSSDQLRRAALAMPQDTSLKAAPDAGAYTPEVRALVYDRMLRDARAHLSLGHPVILDATHAQRALRMPACALADELEIPFFAIEVDAGDEVVRARLAARSKQAVAASDAGWDVYLAQKAHFEPLDEIPASARMRIDGAAPLSASVDAILLRLPEAGAFARTMPLENGRPRGRPL